MQRETNKQRGARVRGWLEQLARGGALFLGSYFLWSWLMVASSGSRYDATIWWVDLRVLPGFVPELMSIAFGIALLHRVVIPNASQRIARIRSFVLWCMVGMLAFNTLGALSVHSTGQVVLGMPLPLTAVLAVAVALLIRVRPDITGASSTLFQRLRRSVRVAGLAACFALLAALAQMLWFGESDYRRPADAIVVYGCKAYADGRPSQALADRVHTACALYHEGLAPLIVMSGGPVRNAEMHETQAMADYAVSLGVPREAIVLDPNGLDTQATAENFVKVFSDVPGTSRAGSIRLLAVSHDYHLPRVKLSLERQGLTAYTVPAEIRRGLPSKPYLMARETAAWWYYFFRPIVASTR